MVWVTVWFVSSAQRLLKAQADKAIVVSATLPTVLDPLDFKLSNLSSAHAYTVLACVQSRWGPRLVKLRNPCMCACTSSRK